jgi:hypothetical protein
VSAGRGEGARGWVVPPTDRLSAACPSTLERITDERNVKMHLPVAWPAKPARSGPLAHEVVKRPGCLWPGRGHIGADREPVSCTTIPPTRCPSCMPRRAAMCREKLEGGRRFVMQSEFKAAGDQPTAIAELSKRHPGGRAQSGAAGRHRHRQDLHHGQGDRGNPAPRHHPCAQQDAGRAALRRVQGLLPRQRGRILRQLLRLLPARSLCARGPTPTSRRNPRSTNRSTGCAIRPPGRFWNATT